MATVDDRPMGLKEADRLGAQLLSGYQPTELVQAEFLIDCYDNHVVLDHDESVCSEVKFWRLITGNKFFAALLRDEALRHQLREQLVELNVDHTLPMSMELQVVSGLLSDDTLRAFQNGFQHWSHLRLEEIAAAAPADAQGEALAQICIWEGFMAGIMFVHSMGGTYGPQ